MTLSNYDRHRKIMADDLLLDLLEEGLSWSARLGLLSVALQGIGDRRPWRTPSSNRTDVADALLSTEELGQFLRHYFSLADAFFPQALSHALSKLSAVKDIQNDLVDALRMRPTPERLSAVGCALLLSPQKKSEIYQRWMRRWTQALICAVSEAVKPALKYFVPPADVDPLAYFEATCDEANRQLADRRSPDAVDSLARFLLTFHSLAENVHARLHAFSPSLLERYVQKAPAFLSEHIIAVARGAKTKRLGKIVLTALLERFLTAGEEPDPRLIDRLDVCESRFFDSSIELFRQKRADKRFLTFLKPEFSAMIALRGNAMPEGEGINGDADRMIAALTYLKGDHVDAERLAKTYGSALPPLLNALGRSHMLRSELAFRLGPRAIAALADACLRLYPHARLPQNEINGGIYLHLRERIEEQTTRTGLYWLLLWRAVVQAPDSMRIDLKDNFYAEENGFVENEIAELVEKAIDAVSERLDREEDTRYFLDEATVKLCAAFSSFVSERKEREPLLSDKFRYLLSQLLGIFPETYRVLYENLPQVQQTTQTRSHPSVVFYDAQITPQAPPALFRRLFRGGDWDAIYELMRMNPSPPFSDERSLKALSLIARLFEAVTRLPVEEHIRQQGGRRRLIVLFHAHRGYGIVCRSPSDKTVIRFLPDVPRYAPASWSAEALHENRVEETIRSLAKEVEFHKALCFQVEPVPTPVRKRTKKGEIAFGYRLLEGEVKIFEKERLGGSSYAYIL